MIILSPLSRNSRPIRPKDHVPAGLIRSWLHTPDDHDSLALIEEEKVLGELPDLGEPEPMEESHSGRLRDNRLDHCGFSWRDSVNNSLI